MMREHNRRRRARARAAREEDRRRRLETAGPCPCGSGRPRRDCDPHPIAVCIEDGCDNAFHKRGGRQVRCDPHQLERNAESTRASSRRHYDRHKRVTKSGGQLALEVDITHDDVRSRTSDVTNSAGEGSA